jgi:hypothetical protein
MADNIKDRVARLEADVAELRAALSQSKRPGWLAAAEKFAGDEDLLAVFAEAKKLREEERKKARKSRSRRSAT